MKNSDKSCRNPAQNALAWSVESGRADDVLWHMERALTRRRRRCIVVMTTAAAMIVGVALVWRFPEAPSLQKGPETVVVSRPITQVLSDGTQVELRQGAEIRSEFTTELRRVVLTTGEAHFKVEKDPARPFVVLAGGIEVRAVGTAFSVQLGSQSVDVLVTEGTVRVERSDVDAAQGEVALATLGAGERVSVEVAAPPAAAAVLPVSNQDLNERLSWRVPRLEFNGTPLRQAIAMFNQHGHVKLSLDPELGHLQMSGTLRADGIEALLIMLKNEFEIEAERRSDTEIYLRRP